MFHLRFGLSDHLKALLDFVFGSRRRVKKVRIFRAWFSQISLSVELVCALSLENSESEDCIICRLYLRSVSLLCEKEIVGVSVS